MNCFIYTIRMTGKIAVMLVEALFLELECVLLWLDENF